MILFSIISTVPVFPASSLPVYRNSENTYVAEIAALSEKEQKELLVAMEYAQAIPSLSQAQRIRQMSKEKQLSLEKMEEIMCEVKKGEITRVAFTNEQLHKYFSLNAAISTAGQKEMISSSSFCNISGISFVSEIVKKLLLTN